MIQICHSLQLRSQNHLFDGHCSVWVIDTFPIADIFQCWDTLPKLGPLQFAVGWRGIAKSWATFLKLAALEKRCGVVSVESRFCFHGLNLFEARLCSIREKRSTRNLFFEVLQKKTCLFPLKISHFSVPFFPPWTWE